MITYIYSNRDIVADRDNPQDKVVVKLDDRVVGAIVPFKALKFDKTYTDGYQYVTKNGHRGQVFLKFRDVVRSIEFEESEELEAVKILRTRAFKVSGTLDAPELVVLSSIDGTKSVKLTEHDYIAAVFKAFTGSDIGGM